MADFDVSFTEAMRFEGGFGSDPCDRGGETYRGIARLRNSDWSGWRRIDALKCRSDFPACLNTDKCLQRSVRAFYKKFYWDMLKGDEIPDQGLADELFDTAVNLGVSRAVAFLQEGLNLLNRDGALYADIVGDGVADGRTLSALKSYLRHDDSGYLVKIINILQGAHYLKLLSENSSQERFARGWLNRVEVRKTHA